MMTCKKCLAFAFFGAVARRILVLQLSLYCSFFLIAAPGMGRLVSPSRAVREKKNCCMIQLPTMNPFGYISFWGFWSLDVLYCTQHVCTEDLPLLFRLCDARSEMRPEMQLS